MYLEEALRSVICVPSDEYLIDTRRLFDMSHCSVLDSQLISYSKALYGSFPFREAQFFLRIKTTGE